MFHSKILRGEKNHYVEHKTLPSCCPIFEQRVGSMASV